MDKLKMQSENLIERNVGKIAEMFPNCITEVINGYSLDGKVYDSPIIGGEPITQRVVDFDLLRQELSSVLVEGKDERYRLDWSGKRQAILTANSPIAKTLRPVIDDETTPTGADSKGNAYKSTGSVGKDGTKGGFDSENLYIEGDNLDVLKLLHETYLAKIKMIYIDPPYNTGNDFVYNDNFSQDAEEYLASSNQVDEDKNKLTTNKDTSGRYHSDWLSMMYMRLKLARDLLTDDGVIFISIDDNEQANLKKICDEVFGESCFVCDAIWRSTDNSNNDAKQFSADHNSTIIYSKTPLWSPNKIFDSSKQSHFKNPDNDPRGAYFDGNPLNSPNYRENLCYDIISPNGNIIKPPTNGWRWSKETLEDKMSSGEIRFNKDETNIKRRTYLCDMNGLPPSSLWTDLEQTGHNRQAKYELLKLLPENVFDTPKPTKLIKFMVNLLQDSDNSIILDFFSGSGTTAEAVLQSNAEDGKNRKFIMVQLPEDLDESIKTASNDKKTVLKNAINLCDTLKASHKLSEIAKERIRRAGAKIAEANQMTAPNLDIGFRVLKLDSSNMKDVYYNPSEYLEKGQSFLFELDQSIKADRTAEDILLQVMLDKGVLLSSKIEKRIAAANNQTYYVVGNTDFDIIDLICCLDAKVNTDAVKEIAKLKPECCVFLDSGIANDSTRTNIEQIFDTYSPTTKVEVI